MLGFTVTGRFLTCAPRPPKKDGGEYAYPFKTMVMTSQNSYEICTSEKIDREFGEEVTILIERINTFKDNLYFYGYEVEA